MNKIPICLLAFLLGAVVLLQFSCWGLFATGNLVYLIALSTSFIALLFVCIQLLNALLSSSQDPVPPQVHVVLLQVDPPAPYDPLLAAVQKRM